MDDKIDLIEQAAARFADELAGIDGIEMHETLYIAAVEIDGKLMLASGSTSEAPEGLRETMLTEALNRLQQQ